MIVSGGWGGMEDMKEMPRMTSMLSFGVALVYKVPCLFWNDSEYLYLERAGRKQRT